MTIQKLPGSAITPGTITVTQLESSVATTVQTGGGPKLTNIQVTDNTYTVLDDTAVDVTGGYIKITGTGFVTGCSVIVGQLPAASVTFISSTEVRAQLSAQSAGTYIVYLVNPDGGVGIRVNGVTHSASPAWQTASGLPDQYDGVAINLSLVATDATSYTLTSGSLPPGLSLNGNTGVISGTISGVANDTLYTFTVRATDAQLQDSPRTFTVTITVSDPYFKLTTLLLSGSAISANTVIRDSSTNNFNLTVAGDARASNFTPYGTGWSNYFDGTGDWLVISHSAGIALSSGATAADNFTVECWFYPAVGGIFQGIFTKRAAGEEWNFSLFNTNIFKFGSSVADYTSGLAVNIAAWNHLAVSWDGTTLRTYVNGVAGTTHTNFSLTAGTNTLAIGSGQSGSSVNPINGYISNARILKGSGAAIYSGSTITIPTAPFTVTALTQLLTAQDNRFIDRSTNAATITRNGDTKVTSFNPFNITNTGVNGSAYFDGTDDRLVGPTSTILDLDGAINFTIEAWVYPTSYGSTADMSLHIVRKFTGAGGVGYAYGIQGGGANQGKISLYGAGGSISLTSTNQVPINTWSHICVVKNSTTFTHYLNGQPNGSVTTATTLTASTDNLLIADYGYAEKFKGYMSELRIVKGTAVYTSAFTPPTSPLTAITNTQLLTLQYDQPHNNHTFLDSSSNQFLITRSGNATQGTFSPFSPGGWSNYFDGTGDYLTVASNAALDFGSGDFTIEGWFYFTNNNGSLQTIWAYRSTTVTYGGACMVFDGSFNITLYLTNSTAGWTAPNVSTGLTASLNQWQHIALVRSGNTITTYKNGAAGTPYTYTTSIVGAGGWSVMAGSNSGGQEVQGYVSNYRIVKGTAVYTSNFTPSTAPLTAISGTSLLTCQSNRFRDASTNNFAITVTGDSKVVAFSPFAPTAVYSPAIHGGSGYFDGSGDYARIGSDITPLSFLNTAGAVATIEAWVYATSLRAGSQSYTHPCILGIGSTYMNFGVANGTPRFYWWNGAAGTTLDSSITITANTWNHIALVFSGTGSNNYKIFVNGTLGGTGTFTNIGWASASGGNNVLVGREEANPATSDWPGYISGLRIINGSALYNSSFTPATTPFTSTANTICLLNFTDAGIIDSTGRNAIETGGDAKVTTIQTKFGTTSQFYNGSNTNLVVPVQPYFSFPGTTSFTVEAWVYFNDLNTQLRPLIALGDGANGSGPIYMAWSMQYWGTEGSNQISWGRYDGTSYTYLTSGLSLVANTWYHIAVSRDSANTLRIFVNGTSYYSATVTQTFAQINSNPLRIGLSYNGPQEGYGGPRYFNGYIDGIRITQGYARYTANFTAPTAPARLK